MASVKVICDSNFTKTEDIDKSIGKVLKMFSKHLQKTTAPLSKSSDMECVYLYTKLSPDKVRLMKKMLKSNKTLLHFKEIVISDPGSTKECSDGNESSSSECSVKSSSCSVKSIPNVSGSVSDSNSNSNSNSCSNSNSNSDSDSESPLSKTCSKPFSKKKNSKKATSKKKAFGKGNSDSESESEFEHESESEESEPDKRYREISEQLRELADEIEKFR